MIEAMGAASLVDGDMAAAALVEGVAGSVLEAIGGDAAEEPSIARLRGLPWSYGGKEVVNFANASPARTRRRKRSPCFTTPLAKPT